MKHLLLCLLAVGLAAPRVARAEETRVIGGTTYACEDSATKPGTKWCRDLEKVRKNEEAYRACMERYGQDAAREASCRGGISLCIPCQVGYACSCARQLWKLNKNELDAMAARRDALLAKRRAAEQAAAVQPAPPPAAPARDAKELARHQELARQEQERQQMVAKTKAAAIQQSQLARQRRDCNAGVKSACGGQSGTRGPPRAVPQ